MIWIDRGLALLLMLGAIGHSAGSFKAYGQQPDTLLWSLNSGVLIVLIAWLNLWRSGRPGDGALAWTCLVATAAYLCSVFAFGRVIGNMADPRVIGFAVVCLGLIGFSLRGVARA